MPELPQKKVGVIACSGEELPEGTVTRLAALRVLEQLRPGDTVTICLPLFLAGVEGDGNDGVVAHIGEILDGAEAEFFVNDNIAAFETGR